MTNKSSKTKPETYVRNEKCVHPKCGHEWGDHWDEGPCVNVDCPCIGMVRKSDSDDSQDSSRGSK